MPITCGNCRQSHWTSKEVQECYASEGTVKTEEPEGKWSMDLTQRFGGTDKQRQFIVDLYKRKEIPREDYPQTADELLCAITSVDDASKAIDSLLELPDKGVAEGRYAFEEGGRMRFFQVRKPDEGRWKGYTFVDELFGSPGDFSKEGVRNRSERERILKVIANDDDALARFGRELGICGVCGSPLTNEESRALGIGPVCRGDR